MAVTSSFKFRSALVAVTCRHSSCWDLVALIRRLAVWRWITHSPLPALLQPHEAQTSAPVIPGSWFSPCHPDTVTPTRHWLHEIKQQCSRQIVNYAQHMHYGTQSATVITVTHTLSVSWLFSSGGANVSVQPPHSTRSSSLITLTRLPQSSSLCITDRSFMYTCLWNQLLSCLRQHHSVLSVCDLSVPRWFIHLQTVTSPSTCSNLVRHRETTLIITS